MLLVYLIMNICIEAVNLSAPLLKLKHTDFLLNFCLKNRELTTLNAKQVSLF